MFPLSSILIKLFSSKALVFLQDNRLECTLRKVFVRYCFSKKVGKPAISTTKIYSLIRKTFQILYLKHGNLKPLFNKFMEMRGATYQNGIPNRKPRAPYQ